MTESKGSNFNGTPHVALALIGKILLGIWCLLVYFGFSALQKNEFWPGNWDYRAVYWAATFILISLLVYTAALASYGELEAEKWLSKVTNLTEYQDKTKFDSFLSHYTNVATVGLFITILIFTGKEFLSSTPSLWALIATMITFAIFFLYAVLYAKLVLRFSKKGELPIGWYMFVSALVLLIDAQAFKFFIASTS